MIDWVMALFPYPPGALFLVVVLTALYHFSVVWDNE